MAGTNTRRCRQKTGHIMRQRAFLPSPLSPIPYRLLRQQSWRKNDRNSVNQHVAVFLNRCDHFSITEVAQSSADGGGDQEAEGVSRAPFVRVVERDEALNDGLPRDNVAQEDQIMGGVRQVSLDPLRTKRVFECLYYHGKDLCVGGREMLCSTLSHRSEVTETCPGRENQQILVSLAALPPVGPPMHQVSFSGIVRHLGD